MKTILDITKGFMAASVLSVALSGCSEDVMDRINKDNDHTTDVQAKFILADVITRTAFCNVGSDLNTYEASYVEHEVGTHNQLYRAEHRSNEPIASTTFNNTWGYLYTTLKNVRVIIDKCSEGGTQEGNDVTKGMGEVMAALTAGILTDSFGDTPYSEASLISEDGTPVHMQPKIDTQESIYTDIHALLDQAIIDLQGTDSHASGAAREYDLLYSGDAEKWVKFAYGLKARYTMHTLLRAADQRQALENVIAYADQSFQSADEQAAFAWYDANNLNPLFDFFWSREALAASQSMSEKLIERNDPRIRRVFVEAVNDDNIINRVEGPDSENFFMAPNGENEQLQTYYNTSIFVYAQTAPTLLMSYHEVLFLKAEALARLGRADEAKAVLKEAVIAGIANMENSVSAALTAPQVLNTYGGIVETTEAITPEEAATYFDNEVAPLFDANPVKEIMNQKYIAFFGASGESPEAYNDIRRLMALGEEDFITLKNPNNDSRFPLRCPYGNDDTTTSPEVQSAYGNGQYVYTEPVWWAGGTR